MSTYFKDITYRQIVQSSYLCAKRCGTPLNDVSRAGELLDAYPAVEAAIVACPPHDVDVLNHLFRVLEEELDMSETVASALEKADTEPAPALAASR